MKPREDLLMDLTRPKRSRKRELRKLQTHAQLMYSAETTRERLLLNPKPL
jgi:hypothetical protein